MTDDNTPARAGLTATEARRRLVAGEFSAVDYVRALLGRIEQVESDVQAWAHLDSAYALAQAEACDAARAAGEPEGLLHGLPVGIKDIVDTADLPTENGTLLHAGRRPQQDAVVVQRLRAAGGIVFGKTVTTELATYAAGKTRNPHDPTRTPGGSSSGSAAAVAAGMVPLAIGTQTNGSVIRPASFCGVYGYKPSAGLLPRTGVLMQSPAFDTVGVFGRSLEDVALLAEAIGGHDPADPSSRMQAPPPLMRMAAADMAKPPTLGWIETPFWERVDADAKAAFGKLLEVLSGRVEPSPLPDHTGEALDWHRTVMEADIAGSFEDEYERGRDRLSSSLRGQIERGRGVSAVAYRRALERVPMMLSSLDPVFGRFDALLTPATLGTAPTGAETGDPVMCTLWSFLGMPSLSLPLLHGDGGLPIGVQLVGRRGDDACLLRTAHWLVDAANKASR